MFTRKFDVTQKTIDFVNSYGSEKSIELIAQKLLDAIPEAKTADIDPISVEDEARCMILELFSTACAVRNINLAIEQSIFMKKYLHERFLGDCWENMKPYNNAVSESATIGLDGTTPKGRFKITYITQNRFNMGKIYLDKYGKENADEAVGRGINRFGVAPSKMSQLMAVVLCDELGIEPRQLDSLTEFIFNLYKVTYGFVKK